MTDVDLDETIFTILSRIAPEADPHTVTPTEDLRETLGIDSFDFLNFIVALNEQLGVEIPELDYGQLTTLEGIHRYLAARVN